MIVNAYTNVGTSFFSFCHNHAFDRQRGVWTDGQTDGQTDRQTDISLVAKTALHRCSAVTYDSNGRYSI